MLMGGFRIGRIAGINIEVDWSWLLIFFLVVSNLGAGFLQLHSDWGPGLVWVLAALSALLFFASVLLHELAHSLVAQAQGTPVKNITLFMFGGVSNIQRHPESPLNEFLMAIVGPLTSLVLGGICVFLASAAVAPVANTFADPIGAAVRMGPAITLLGWLGYVNILVGLFNLIPGFPLDGGRVLRSILWAITRNLRRATRWAAAVGQAVGWTFILMGAIMVFGVRVPYFGTGFLSGLWLAFIGWFLSNAAQQSYRQVVIRDALSGLRVARLMRPNPVTVPPDLSLETLVHEHLLQGEDRSYPVSSNGTLLGIVSLDDVRSVPREQWPAARVADHMTPAERVASTTPDQDAAEALNTLIGREVRQLPVLDGGHLVGVLRLRDVLRWLQINGNDNGKDEV